MNTLASPLQINALSDCLVIRFPEIFECSSWAPWNGGEVSASAVVNRQVDHHVSCSLDTMADDFRCLFRKVALIPEQTIGLLTAANVSGYQDFVLNSSDVWVHAVATVGLSNARSILDDADVELGDRCGSKGTVNLVVGTNALPTVGGRFQAVHIAASAKAAAFRDMSVTSRKSNRPADLTGTDCLVVGSSGEIEEDQCGLHTVLGEMIGRVVYGVVSKGIAESLRPNGDDMVNGMMSN